MAEHIARLFGPASLSANQTSPTTLFTVPTGKLYVLRQLLATSAPVSGSTVSPTIALGKTSLALPNLVAGLGITTSTSVYSSSSLSLAVPMYEAEALVGFTSLSVAPTRTEYNSVNTTDFAGFISSTDNSTFASSAFTPQTINVPTNVYYMIANWKASSPDTVSTITDAHTNPVTNLGNIVTSASTGVRTTIWGGYSATQPTGNNAITFTHGGTWTAIVAKGISVKNSSYVPGTPSTSNVILQTATNTGTTEASQGVTMTPTYALGTYQILFIAANGVGSTYTGPTAAAGGTVTEVADGNGTVPSFTAAGYFITPAVTNPAATIASTVGLSDWSAVCIEVAYGGFPGITLSGVIID